MHLYFAFNFKIKPNQFEQESNFIIIIIITGKVKFNKNALKLSKIEINFFVYSIY